MHDFKCLLASIALLAACGVEDPGDLSNTSQDILFGTPTLLRPEVGQFLETPKSAGCVATLISSKTFLTTADCINNQWQFLGGTFQFADGTTIPVLKSYAQGLSGHDDDLAVGVLARAAPSTIHPAAISLNEPSPGWLTALGYGCTSDRNTLDNCRAGAHRAELEYNWNGGDTYYVDETTGLDVGSPVFLGHFADNGPIVRVQQFPKYSNNGFQDDADWGADPVKYRQQLLTMSDDLQLASGVAYRAELQDIGWQQPFANNNTAGTPLQKRMEALQIWTNNTNEGVCYSANVQGYGWQADVCDGAVAGTVGQSLRMEAVRIRHTGSTAHGVQYRTFVHGLGWQPWVKDYAVSGTTGQSRQIEEIEIGFYDRTIVVNPGGPCATCLN